MARKYGKRSRRQMSADLDVTTFMNLMVILVPFLLITAVFTQLTVLEINLPKDGRATEKRKKPPLELQVVIRKDALLLADNRGGLIKRVPTVKQVHNYRLLARALKQVKARLPDKNSITILSEPDTSYDTLIQVMDAVRTYQAVLDGEVVTAELFPNISIGDAPKIRKRK